MLALVAAARAARPAASSTLPSTAWRVLGSRGYAASTTETVRKKQRARARA